jgi:Flp pilus assembly protein TadG
MEGALERMSTRGKFRNAGGNALVEFALVLPLVLTGIFGVIDFGRALYTYHFVSNAAREATRWASVRGATCNPALYTSACPAGRNDVQEFVASITPAGIDASPSKLVVDTDWLVPPGKTNPCTGSPKNPGCAVQVQVTYNFKFVLPFLPKATYPMKSTSEMIISQ